MVPSHLVGGQKAEIPTGAGYVNSAGTGSFLANTDGFVFTGTITIPALAVSGSLDLAVSASAADQALNADIDMNHATAVGVGVDATAVQHTGTARTGGYLAAFRAATTSLATDSGSPQYYDYLAGTPTDGGGTVLHVAFGALRGHDRLIDASDALTGQNDIVVPSNVADAINFTNGTLTYWTLITSTATPRISEGFTQTSSAAAHTIAGAFNSASSTSTTLAVTATQDTTVRTSGTVAGVKSTITSLSGDTAGVDYYAFQGAAVVGEANADHILLYQGAGFDRTIDSSAAASGEVVWFLPDAVANALTIEDSAGNDFLVIDTAAADSMSFGNATTNPTYAFLGTGAASFAGGITLPDSKSIILGTGSDDTISHDGVSTTWTHTTGGLLIDSTSATGLVTVRLGTDTSATAFNVNNDSDVAMFTVDGSGGVTLADGAVLALRGKGGTTGDVIQQVGATSTEAFRLVVYDATVSPSAVETNLINLPAGSMIVSVQANVQAALTGGGTTVTWSIGTTGDPDKYGSAGFNSITGAAAADALTQNSKSTWFGDGSHAMSLSAAAEQLVLTGAATGGAADGNTALTVGSVRCRVVYWQLQALDNA